MEQTLSLPPAKEASPAKVLTILVLLLAGMFGVAFYESGTRVAPALLGSAYVTAAAVVVFSLWSLKAGAKLDVTYSARSVHWIQAMVQLSILIELGRFFEGVWQYAPLIVYQVCFAYIVHILLPCVFQRRCELSFAIFPVVFSINIFLWFLPQFYYMQILMIGLAIAGKFFITRKNGRHIFNPSAVVVSLMFYATIPFYAKGLLQFPQAVFFLPTVFAYDINSTVMFVHIFIVSCVSLYLANRFSITIGGVLTMVGMFFLSSAFMGHPVKERIMNPTAFVGMTLLITDPATSPRNKLGQFFYGVLFALGIWGGRGLSHVFNFPVFYDKFIFTPLLNFFMPLFEKIGVGPGEKGLPDKYVQSPVRWYHFAVYGGVFLLLALPYNGHESIVSSALNLDSIPKKPMMIHTTWNDMNIVSDAQRRRFDSGL